MSRRDHGVCRLPSHTRRLAIASSTMPCGSIPAVEGASLFIADKSRRVVERDEEFPRGNWQILTPFFGLKRPSRPFPILAPAASGGETRTRASPGDHCVCLRCPPACRFGSRRLDRSGHGRPVGSRHAVAARRGPREPVWSGQVLVWDGFEAGPNSERLFDPNTLALTPRPYARNLFCSGYAQLADGKLFIAGGHVTVNSGLKDATLWDPTTNTAQRLPDLTNSRWYPTVTTLADGRVHGLFRRQHRVRRLASGQPALVCLTHAARGLQPEYEQLYPADGGEGRHPALPADVRRTGRPRLPGRPGQTDPLRHDDSATGAVVNGPANPIEPHSARHVRPRARSSSRAPGRTRLSRTSRSPAARRSSTSTSRHPTWRETAPMAYPALATTR